MAQKCVHKGCGKLFTDPEDPCSYHPGPPVFHEGQKGWKCCKPRVLTFDEFMTIPPCTTGKHSTVDDTPAPEPQSSKEDVDAKIEASRVKKEQGTAQPAVSRQPIAAAQPPQPSSSPAPPEPEDDDPSLPIPANVPCKRRACTATYTPSANRDNEQCLHHPGHPIFHEGSKGYTCCKRRVLEFDDFLNMPGCTTTSYHLFVGAKKDPKAEETLKDIRNDFYQTATTVIASLYLKKIDKERSKVAFPAADTVELDLHTADQTRYTTRMVTFGPIDPEKSSFKIMGTKLELTLVKADGVGWPVLRKDDPHTGEIIQAGRAGRV